MNEYKVKIEMQEFHIKDETKKNDIKLYAAKGDKGDPGPKGETGSPGPQGERGLQGERGPQGEQGIPGQTGPSGRDGKDGEDGYTPIKGVDYFTEEDIDELHIPKKLSDLQNDVGYITDYTETDPIFSSSVASNITSTDITNWNNKSEFSGNYNDLSNKPSLFSGDYNDLSNKPSLFSGSYDDLTNKPTIPDVSNFITKDVNDLTYYPLSSSLSTVATSGSYEDLSNKPTIPPTMSILKYGISTWSDFITAYTSNSIVYCRASSNSNPASGSQTRMAFMAYINNETNPTEVEFQYYRSVSSHSDSQQGDQVFVYKLNKTNGWSVITRNAFTKIVAGTGLKSSYSNGVLTISLDS